MDEFEYDFTESLSDVDEWETEQVFQDREWEEDEEDDFSEFRDLQDSLQDEDAWLDAEYEARSDGYGEALDA
jgi:hypothetical protein